MGKLSIEAFTKALLHSLAVNKEYAFDMFHQVDVNNLGYITFGLCNKTPAECWFD